MVAITVEGKNYELKHRLTVKQMRLTESLGRRFGDIPARIEKEGEDAVVKDLMAVTDAEANFLFSTIGDCLGFTTEQVDSLEYIHAIGIFSALVEASVPPKNLPSQSARPMTGTTSQESATLKPIETLQPKQS